MTPNKPKESTDHSNSEPDKSEEFEKFEDFSKRMGSLTREELDSILEKEKKEKAATRKTRRN